MPAYNNNGDWQSGLSAAIAVIRIEKRTYHFIRNDHANGAVSTYWQPVRLERVSGIEPPSSAWKAVALPLSYTRKCRTGQQNSRSPSCSPARLADGRTLFAVHPPFTLRLGGGSCYSSRPAGASASNTSSKGWARFSGIPCPEPDPSRCEPASSVRHTPLGTIFVAANLQFHQLYVYVATIFSYGTSPERMPTSCANWFIPATNSREIVVS